MFRFQHALVHVWLVCRALALSFCWTVPVAAYSTGTLATDPCHERMTQHALRALRRDVALAAPRIRPTADERALLEDLPFDVPGDLTDLEAATLVLANRDLDLDGVSPGDLTRIAIVQADPALQTQNCLRGPEHDEPTGARQALDACRAFIRDKVQSALSGLRTDGSPDPTARLAFDAVLNLRGSVRVELPRFWVEMGRALHTLQDGFSHTYRVPGDQLEVVTVQNFVDLAEDRLVAERDGPPHSVGLDECANLDELRSRRLVLAERASHELLRAALEPAASSDERLGRVEVVLDRYLSLAQGSCTAQNAWCDAPERRYELGKGCVCTAGAARNDSAPRWLFGSSLLLLLLLARRLRRRGRATTASALVSSALVGSANAANSDGAATQANGREGSSFGGEVAAGGSITHGAFALSVGGRYGLSPRLLLGIDAEYNPWFSLSVGELRSGTTNLYATGIVRFPMRSEPVALRSTLQLGVARLNFHLAGVPEGSIGPFVGFNLLGIDYALSRSLYLVVNPAHVAIPIPQIEVVPFAYMQYRVTVGLQYGG